MPLNNEQPTSTSSSEDQNSDAESSSERRDSNTASDLGYSRDSFTSTCSSASSSPPKAVTLDEVMGSAKDLFNLRLSHEITVNRRFQVQEDPLPQDSLMKMVQNNLHKAYWDILEAELNDDPPEYEHAIRLVEDIREVLLSFLLPGANRMRTQILEVLDMDLIRQQVDNDAIDIQGLASYIITTMGKLCSPSRDEEIKKLREGSDNIVILFREIFRVLDLMKVDNINMSIDILKPVLHTHGVEYERQKFQQILEKSPNALDRTTSWIKSALEELLSATGPSEQISNQGKGQRAMPGPFQILNAAFLHILTWDYKKDRLPETWMTDESRLQEIQWQLQQGQAVNAVMLLVYSTIGEPIQNLPSLSARLTLMTSALLEEMHRPNFNLEEALQGISARICCELNKSLTERSYPALTPALQATLTGQICNIAQKDNPIRTLVEDRVQQYFKALICDPKPQLKVEEVPAGLEPIRPVLSVLGARFISLVNYNRSVYGPFYADIIRKLILSNSPPAPPPTPPQDKTKDFVALD